MLEAEGRFTEAQRAYERALAIDEGALGPGHSATARSLNNLALLLKSQGRFPEAKPLFERAFAILASNEGSEDPATAMVLHNLGVLLKSEGDYSAARSHLERALEIRARVLGDEHFDTLVTQSSLAALLLDEGEDDAASRLVDRLMSASWVDLRQRMHRSVASEILRVVETHRRAIDLFLSLPRTRHAASGAAMSYGEVLRRKGLVLRELSSQRDALMEVLDAGTREKLVELRSVRAAISNLLSARAIENREQYRLDVGELRRMRIQLEADVARLIEARPELQPVTFEHVSAALPKDTVLVDFLAHAHYEAAVRNDGVLGRNG